MILGIESIQAPGLGAKWTIGSIALFHTAVASLGIGFATIVTVLQIVGYLRRDRGYDLLAKRTQLIHVCMYNIGTINAIGLVFALSGLYPQFWSQIFVQFFWSIIIEELLFLLLATTITFHYFFWDKLWGHKKLQVFLGALLNPLFFLQFYIINGMGGFMLTPGFAENQATVNTPVLGWDKFGFYNPSFLMLTFHRLLANISYGGFVVAGLCGIMLYLSKDAVRRRFYHRGGRAAFFIAFAAFLGLPIVGYFYAMALKHSARIAYDNLMIGRGDVVAGGIDWWWLKHVIVVTMLVFALVYFRKDHKTAGEGEANADGPPAAGNGRAGGFTLPMAMIFAVAGFYLMYYVGMGQVMTWTFTWGMIAAAGAAWLVGGHLLRSQNGNPRLLFTVVGVLSFFTVMFGGYVREASRPRFVAGAHVVAGQIEPVYAEGQNRLAYYDAVERIFPADQRQAVLMRQDLSEEQRAAIRAAATQPALGPADRLLAPPRTETGEPADWISARCITCHSLQWVKDYPRDDWDRVLWRMKAYGARIDNEQAARIIRHLQEGRPF